VPTRKTKTKEQDHQTLLKAKYYPRVAAAFCTRPWPFTYDLEIQ